MRKLKFFTCMVASSVIVNVVYFCVSLSDFSEDSIAQNHRTFQGKAAAGFDITLRKRDDGSIEARIQPYATATAVSWKWILAPGAILKSAPDAFGNKTLNAQDVFQTTLNADFQNAVNQRVVLQVQGFVDGRKAGTAAVIDLAAPEYSNKANNMLRSLHRSSASVDAPAISQLIFQ